jgi:cobalt/nickel transport system permease protein
MHIPDGYLSPTTCVVTLAIALPFWIVALKQVKSRMHSRMVPLLAMFSAFSFVVMMFNLPLPGGTTGHAVGMTIAAIVLGPWAAVLAISIALFIQALFFGDGGLTTLAANCLNMGIVGSLVAYGLYRLIAGESELTARRRVVAAGIAGYVAINVAALITAIEFGVQPLWFYAADGTPLYAPYPLAVAIPAMMIGHLGLAGLAEAFVTAGLVAWLQRSDPQLLRASLPGNEPSASGWSGTRKLWAGLGVLMVLSPLGLVAAGTAWGEWAAEDYTNPQVRQEITAASGHHPAPTQTPPGLAKLSTLWKSPLPDYEFASLPAPVGYVLSAIMGSGLLILLWAVFGRLLLMRRQTAD